MNSRKDGPSFREIRSLAAAASGVVNITGISESRASAVAGLVAETGKKQMLILVSGYGRAKRLAEDLAFFVDRSVYVMPEEERALLRYDARSHEDLNRRLTALTALAKGEPCIVVAPVSAALKKLVPREQFIRNRLRFVPEQETDLEDVKRRLSLMGYERVGTVESKGQFSIRGGILDVFPADCENPCRIEFFDTDVDGMRTFDVLSQRSLENLREIFIYPAEQFLAEEEVKEAGVARIRSAYEEYAERASEEQREKLKAQLERILLCAETGTNLQLLEQYIAYFTEKPACLWDYLEPKGSIVIDDVDRVIEAVELADREAVEDFKRLLEKGEAIPEDITSVPRGEDLERGISERPAFLFSSFPKQLPWAGPLKALVNVVSRQAPVFNGRMDLLESELKRYVKQGYETWILCATEERHENLKHFLQGNGLDAKVRLFTASLSAGMVFPEEKWVIISDSDIFLRSKQTRTGRKKRKGDPIKAFTDIRQGDYIVHENHGIGKFIGVQQLDIQGIRKDYLKIKYAGEDLLYVPVEQMDAIQKYVGGDGNAPKINKLDGMEWKKTKAKAKAAIQEMAQDLLELSAARQTEKGHAFGTDSVWQRQFEDAFPYRETDDQLRSVREIKRDMEKPVPMDRLLCGDVGYGKTEVAARAIFKCLADGYQAAVLVPTTVLANQHYLNFKERFADFPFGVDVLCRFRNEHEQEATVRKMKDGEVDLVVGTHRLLSKDVHFKNLGLLVVDEEQRFGVQHKEALKLLRRNVDVLTLSATPIPRTLHMSLVGIRDMSLIEEPPEDRYPVQTYVMEQDPQVLREAVERELDRDGQVFVVFNRIRGIQRTAQLIRELVPHASVAAAHGQMNENQLEKIMMDFVERKYNVLVCTTIIESGLDIQNANTMIVLDADRFGLSQLYQLRGRVGRSNRMAYAYLLYQKDKVLSEQASKRLRAIREFTEFGSGFRIAMRDLEIRGAGNLLGTAQSGHMMEIGYELYCKLVEDAVRSLSEGLRPEETEEMQEEIVIELGVEAHIPETYIEDEQVRLQMYKKIAAVRDAFDEGEVIDEFNDRFGDMPRQVENLVGIARIKAMAMEIGILRVRREKQKVVLDFGPRYKLAPEKIALLSEAYGMDLLIHGGKVPCIKVNVRKGDWVKAATDLLTKLTVSYKIE